MRVLDVDLDYFMKKVKRNLPRGVTQRLNEKEYIDSVWEEEEVKAFLENQLGLSKERKIPGRVLVGHDEALLFWEEQLQRGQLVDPFEVVHVDSHADLGLGSRSHGFFQNEFLLLNKDKRREIRSFTDCAGRKWGIDIDDYLLWAVAYQMVSRIVYCSNPNDQCDDYVLHTLKDFQENRCDGRHPINNYIQLKYNLSLKMPRLVDNDAFDFVERRNYLATAIKDPVVELTIIPTVEGVSFAHGDFAFATIAQSPQYTPEKADYILDVFSEYINII